MISAGSRIEEQELHNIRTNKERQKCINKKLELGNALNVLMASGWNET